MHREINTMIAKLSREIGVVMVFALLIPPAVCRSQHTSNSVAEGRGVVISLKNEFIKKYRDRATIDTRFTVDVVGKEHPPKDDGDMHLSGRAPEVELPIVAEIMNAKFHHGAEALVRDHEGDGQLAMSGAWRLWAEHAGTKPQIQGEQLRPFDDSNPDHVFEIHPITKVGTIPLLESFKNIEGYKPKEAHAAFVHYENVRCKIEPHGTTTKIITQMAGYNIVEFILEVNGPQKQVQDGTMVLCRVLDTEGEILVRNRRMVFVGGTEPEKRLKNLGADQKRLHVLGIPRIDLALVQWRLDNRDDQREPLTWNLPYEMIIAAVLPDIDDTD